jgi:DnaJ-class molecular chaperone
MDNIIKNAPMSGGMSDSYYDRSEDAEVKMETCPECDGNGVIYYCGECDEDAHVCKCGKDQILLSETCDDCNGDGEVEI